MKFNKIVTLGLAVAGLAFSAVAQNDLFSTTRLLQVVPQQTFVSGQSPLTNAWVDLIGYSGRGVILFSAGTNAPTAAGGGGGLAVQVQTSPDTNTWTDLQNYALITSQTSVTYTNLYYSTNFITTDLYLQPWTTTTPTAATAGWATPYSAFNLFTNTASTNLLNSGGIVYGINLTDCPRFLHVVLLNATSAKTNTVSGWLFGPRTIQ